MVQFNNPMVFKRFGVNHLSPNHLDDFVTRNGMWIMKRGFGFEEDPNPTMIKGSAVGKGLAFNFARNLNNVDDAVTFAETFYDKELEHLDDNDEKKIAVRKTLRPTIIKAVEYLRDKGQFVDSERKIELDTAKMFDNPLYPPMTGYSDLTFKDNNGNEFTVEIKCPTSKKELSWGYKMQGLYYYHCGNTNPNVENESEILTLIPISNYDRKTKVSTPNCEPIPHKLKDIAHNLDYFTELEYALRSMYNVFKNNETWQDIADNNPINPDDWYWDTPKKLKWRQKIWGI